MDRFTGIDEVLDINDINRRWFQIPHFNGYELSNDGIIRSLKLFKKYPFGILIKPINKKGHEPTYAMTNNDGERVSMSFSEIVNLVKTSPNKSQSCLTICTNTRSRNISYFTKPKNQYQFDETPRIPKFTIIK